MRGSRRWCAILAALMLAACGRQGELVPPEDAAPADPAIERYFEGGLDGPIKAPGDTETDEPLRRPRPHQHGDASESGGEAADQSDESRESAGDGDGSGAR